MAFLTLTLAKPWYVRDFANFLGTIDEMYNRFRLFEDMVRFREKEPKVFLRFLETAEAEIIRRFPGERLAIQRISIQSDGTITVKDGGIIKELRDTLRFFIYGRKYAEQLEKIRAERERLELEWESDKENIDIEKRKLEVQEKQVCIFEKKVEIEGKHLANLERKRKLLEEMGHSSEDIKQIMNSLMFPPNELRKYIEDGRITDVLDEDEEDEGNDRT